MWIEVVRTGTGLRPKASDPERDRDQNLVPVNLNNEISHFSNEQPQ
jgi:hypothetical protein